MTVSPTPQLILTTAQLAQHIDLTTQKTWTLGRSSINSIVLAESAISRHHAKLEIVNNRHCYFVDLNSSNGSQVNSHSVIEPLLLKHGDVITIGTTEMRFHFPFVTHVGSTVPFRPKQVLMMQESATQGIIWQEILCSQGFDVSWVPPAANLQQRISLDATANVLPDLLLVDLEAYKGDALAFCKWCNDTYPHLPLFLILSPEASTSMIEMNSTLPVGSEKVLSTFPSVALCQSIEVFAEQLCSVLSEIGSDAFNQKDLESALQSLEGILSCARIPSLMDAQANVDSNLDEFTILDRKKNPQAQ